jgi:hypothetical protein
MITENQEYTKVCVLRRCGNIEGCEDARLPIFDTDEHGEIIDMKIDGKSLMIDEIWHQISFDNCAQYVDGICLSRFRCRKAQTYCYPIPVIGKKPNRVVAVMFAWYCADRATDAADAAYADAAAAYADAAYADAAAATAAAADAAAATAAAATAAAAYAAAAAAYAADADADAATAAAYADAATAAVDARDRFYLDASREIEKLVESWGDKA